MSPRVRRALGVTLLLLSGAASGLALEHLVILHHRHTEQPQSLAPLMVHLDSALDLTPAQRESVRVIFAHHQVAIDSAWRILHGRVLGVLDSVHRELARVLSPDQIKALHAWMMTHH
jgi:hypothetical protein